ncbi:MAG TPA: hypothetical protein VME41_09410 [Stellaceae bacterium]|nr:hypothetical protein [Stellaceae bacterium]
MIGAAPAAARGLPVRRDRGLRLLVWVFALMSFIAGLGAVGLRVVARTEAAWRRAAGATMTLEIPAEATPARLATVLALLKQTRGIVAARLLTPAETARLLQPWLGPGAQLDGLPLPHLIDLRADPAVAIDFPTLHRELASVAPEAKLDDERTPLAGPQRTARAFRIAFAACIAAGLVSMIPAALFAAGSAAHADRELIDVAHLLGAADRDIVRPFVVRALRLGLAGGVIGALAAAGVLVALARPAAAFLPTQSAAGGFAGWPNWLLLAAVAAAPGIAAALAAQAGLHRRLAALP